MPSSDFTLNPSKLNHSHVICGGISGTATCSSTQLSTRHTFGTMGGSLAVTFASIGKVTVLLNGRTAQEY